jgi:hypothetical protein
MKLSHYLFLCVLLSASLFLAIQYLPGVGDAIEARALSFLSSNAS